MNLLLLLAAEKPKPVQAPKLPDLVHPAAHGLIESVLLFWPLWLLVGLLALGRVALYLRRMRRLSRSGIAEIDRMDGRTFELFLSTLFRRLGYSVEVTRYRGDYGADLVVKRKGRKTAVQAKRSMKRVGIKAVQEAVASKALYGCERALVVANREFTQQARKLARANKVELWDRDVLVAKLLSVRGKRDDTPAPVTAERGPASTPPRVEPTASPAPASATQVASPASAAPVDTGRCARCGDAVSAKVRDYCLARPNQFGGLVYCFKHQRSVRTTVAD